MLVFAFVAFVVLTNPTSVLGLLRLPMTMVQKQKVCVVGGGFGGLYTALKLEKMGREMSSSSINSCPMEITLIDPKDKFVFLPLLYELATGTASVMEVAPRYSDLLEKTNIKFVQGNVRGVDREKYEVTVEQQPGFQSSSSSSSSSTIKYDQLVIACGAQPNMSGGIKGLKEHGIPFTRVEDSYRVKTALRGLLDSDLDVVNVAVLGAGYSGVEVATTIAAFFKERNKAAKVCIVDRNDVIMKTSPTFNRDTALKSLRDKGVNILYNTSVQEVTPSGLVVKEGEKGGSTIIEAELVIATLGIRQSPLLSAFGPTPLTVDEQSKRLLVRDSLQSVNDDNVFALGDCSKIEDVKLPLTAQVAMQQADIVAKNVARMGQRQPLLERFTYLPLGEMLTLGATEAAISGIGGLVELDGALAGAARRLVYAARMPTKEQTVTALLNQLVSGAAFVATKALNSNNNDNNNKQP